MSPARDRETVADVVGVPHTRFVVVLALMLALPAQAGAPPPADPSLLAAHDAYRKRDAAQLAVVRNRLVEEKSHGHFGLH